MIINSKLRKEDESKEVDQRIYRSMIGSLLYVTSSRPDVMQVVGQVARFQAAPKQTHIISVKNIFRDLKGTMDFGLRYPKGNELILIAYSNAYWAGWVDDRRSTSGTNLFLGSCLVSWSSKKTVFSVLINNKSRIYSSSSLLYLDSLDEANPARHTCDMQ